MSTQEHHYDFKFGSDNAGYFTLTIEEGYVKQLVHFVFEEKVIRNVFEYKHEGDTILEVKVNDEPWVDMPIKGNNHFPGCAFLQFLAKVENTYSFTGLNEEDGEPDCTITLKREGDVVTEYIEDEASRVFTLKNNFPISIDWGGPISTRHNSLESARANSPV